MSVEPKTLIEEPVEESIRKAKPFLIALSGVKAIRPEESRLMEAVQAGDNRAFDTLMGPYRDSALRYAFSIVKNKADAEDVVQEAYLKVFLHADRYRKGTPFRPWLMGFIRREGLICLRARRRQYKFKSRYLGRP